MTRRKRQAVSGLTVGLAVAIPVGAELHRYLWWFVVVAVCLLVGAGLAVYGVLHTVESFGMFNEDPGEEKTGPKRDAETITREAQDLINDFRRKHG